MRGDGREVKERCGVKMGRGRGRGRGGKRTSATDLVGSLRPSGPCARVSVS